MKHWFSDLPAFRRDPLGFVLARGNGAADALVPLALGPQKVFLVVDPELVKPILKADEARLDKGRFVHKMKDVVGNSSLTLSGDAHRLRREPLNERLSRGNVERLIPLMTAEIRRLAAHIAMAGSVQVDAVTAQLGLRLVCIALFGHEVLSPQDEQALVASVRSVEDDLADDIFRILPLAPWSHFARRRRRAVARKAMAMVVQHVRSNASDASILKTLEHLGLDEDGLRDEVLTMLLAGHHTTGSAMAWLLYHMAVEPGLMDALAHEAMNACDANGEIRPGALKSAPLSLTVVREVLRLYPSIWWFSREVQQPMELAGHKLTRGTSLIICPWQIHRDPRHWPEPEQFRLDRSYSTRAYLPFGGGPRACVGMGVAMLELQLLALEIAAAYQLSGVVAKPAPEPKASVTLIPPQISMQFRVRDRALSQETAA